jgi:siroheme decarboxylase
MKITNLDKKIISLLQGDMPLGEKPFALLAGDLNLTEDNLLERVQGYLECGLMRRLGAILRHRQAGFAANALCCWCVPEDLAEKTGSIMGMFPEASHVYQREAYPEWPYNFYTMLHGKSQDDLTRIVEKMSKLTGIKDYMMLETLREFKKTSMRYY